MDMSLDLKTQIAVISGLSQDRLNCWLLEHIIDHRAESAPVVAAARLAKGAGWLASRVFGEEAGSFVRSILPIPTAQVPPAYEADDQRVQEACDLLWGDSSQDPLANVPEIRQKLAKIARISTYFEASLQEGNVVLKIRNRQIYNASVLRLSEGTEKSDFAGYLEALSYNKSSLEKLKELLRASVTLISPEKGPAIPDAWYAAAYENLAALEVGADSSSPQGISVALKRLSEDEFKTFAKRCVAEGILGLYSLKQKVNPDEPRSQQELQETQAAMENKTVDFLGGLIILAASAPSGEISVESMTPELHSLAIPAPGMEATAAASESALAIQAPSSEAAAAALSPAFAIKARRPEEDEADEKFSIAELAALALRSIQARGLAQRPAVKRVAADLQFVLAVRASLRTEAHASEIRQGMESVAQLVGKTYAGLKSLVDGTRASEALVGGVGEPSSLSEALTLSLRESHKRALRALAIQSLPDWHERLSQTLRDLSGDSVEIKSDGKMGSLNYSPALRSGVLDEAGGLSARPPRPPRALTNLATRTPPSPADYATMAPKQRHVPTLSTASGWTVDAGTPLQRLRLPREPASPQMRAGPEGPRANLPHELRAEAKARAGQVIAQWQRRNAEEPELRAAAPKLAKAKDPKRHVTFALPLEPPVTPQLTPSGPTTAVDSERPSLRAAEGLMVAPHSSAVIPARAGISAASATERSSSSKPSVLAALGTFGTLAASGLGLTASFLVGGWPTYARYVLRLGGLVGCFVSALLFADASIQCPEDVPAPVSPAL